MKSLTESTPNPLDWLRQGMTIAAFFGSTALISGAPLHADSRSLFGIGTISAPIFSRNFDEGRYAREVGKRRTFVRRAYMRVQDITNDEQATTANFVLTQLEAAVPDLQGLPSVHFAEIEETSTVILEWIFPTCRLIFNIEEDASESGWGFVSQSGEMLWGGIGSADYPALVQKLLEGSA